MSTRVNPAGKFLSMAEFRKMGSVSSIASDHMSPEKISENFLQMSSKEPDLNPMLKAKSKMMIESDQAVELLIFSI